LSRAKKKKGTVGGDGKTFIGAKQKAGGESKVMFGKERTFAAHHVGHEQRKSDQK